VVADAPLQLPRQIAEDIAAHARAGLPDEACGIVSGVDATATRFHPAGNADASPFRYSIDSQDLLRIVTDIDDAEEDLLAIYHSHTRSPAFPSRTDVELAFWPDAAYLIVSLASDPPDLKAFTIREGRIAKRELQIT
jgi:proteasome lid subunit RPN8/RPN11